MNDVLLLQPLYILNQTSKNMSISNEPSSSSDDDDIIEALKEATDSQFLKESLFRSKKETENKGTGEKTELPKSLRREIEYVEKSNEFGVTEDFKNFVAKQLAKSLDKSVEEIDNENCSELNDEKRKKKKKNKNKNKRENDSGGIKLLSDSKVDLNDREIDNKEINIQDNKRRRIELRGKDNSAECISKCREVAVQPDWILSKASTAMWTDRQKGTLYKYKKSEDGDLIEINESKT